MQRTADQWQLIFESYLSAVESGELITGKLEQEAVARHRCDVENADELGIYFDWDEAARVLNIMSLCKWSTGEYAGQLVDLHGFQVFIVASLFGWLRHKDSTRRFRKAFISLGRGNGKSPLLALIMLVLLGFDDEPRNECYLAATKRDQTRIILNEIKRFISADPWLNGYFRQYIWNIHCPSTNSVLEAIGSDSNTADGFVSHGIGKDELHKWQEKHRGLLEVLDTSMGKRRQPLSVAVTTAGGEDSELWMEAYNHVCGILSGEFLGLDYFVYIAEIDDGDDIENPECWPKANPLLASGVVKEEYLQSAIEEARANPAKKSQVRRYHGNKYTTSAVMALSRDDWEACPDTLPDDLEEIRAYAGVDLGFQDDLASFGAIWPLQPICIEEVTINPYAVQCWSWIPEDCERDLSREPWASWIKSGSLFVTPGRYTDVEAMHAFAAELRERYWIGNLAYDANNARGFGVRIEKELGWKTYAFPQTYAKYNEPTGEVLRTIRQGQLYHNANGLLGWAFRNMRLSEDHVDNVMPSKKKSEGKIDPAMAVIMAVGEYLYHGRRVRTEYDPNLERIV